MNSLLIAPLPPPISGNSLPVLVIKETLESIGGVKVIDLKRSKNGSGFAINRLLEISPSLRNVAFNREHFDLAYLTIAESYAGNSRDIAIYLAQHRHLGKFVVHMFGGANMRRILMKRYSVRSLLNRIFLRKVGAIVVEGPTQAEMFVPIVGRSRVHVINNFAEDRLFAEESATSSKFADSNVIRVLFLSNMLEGKGHVELAKAYRMLPERIRSSVQLDFAGKLVSDAEEFLGLIKGERGIVFHGPAYGELREALFRDSHIFCLPTYYKYEGQPFSIIEAYASACCVLTTNHSGIPDIFEDGRNGFAVQPRSPEDLRDKLLGLISSMDLVAQFGRHNWEQARMRHSRSAFVDSFKSIAVAISSL